ncbi:MAG TPA: hypothetical protein VFF24_16940, partial [Acidimicrobiia bacterium]|nr:hypothetical protein [Acidimicrobiia bacterium]
MLRLFVAVVVLGVLWLHWRAGYTFQVRAALDDLPAASERLDDLVEDLRDKRLAYRCKAVLKAHRAGDSSSVAVHVADALERVQHLERFAPLRRRA